MSRGRPSEQPAIVKDIWTLDTIDHKGERSIIKFDRSKSPNGPYSIESIPPKGERQLKVKPEKGKAYNKQPVALVFKTSNRSNAQTKIKVWANENIDYILSAEKLSGVPTIAEILEVGVGQSIINKLKLKYNLK
jgi:hypothetical protein